VHEAIPEWDNLNFHAPIGELPSHGVGLRHESDELHVSCMLHQREQRTTSTAGLARLDAMGH